MRFLSSYLFCLKSFLHNSLFGFSIVCSLCVSDSVFVLDTRQLLSRKFFLYWGAFEITASVWNLLAKTFICKVLESIFDRYWLKTLLEEELAVFYQFFMWNRLSEKSINKSKSTHELFTLPIFHTFLSIW